MLLKKNSCKGCPRFKKGKGYSTTVGQGINNVLIVGEGPLISDIMQEKALTQYSERGAIIRRALGLKSLDIDNFTYTNLSWCHSNELVREELDFCAKAHLKPLIDKLQPRMIVALGDVVAQELTGLSGPKTDIRHTRGYIVSGIKAAQGYPVKLTFDPVMIREGNMNLLGCLAEDLYNATWQNVNRQSYKTHVGLHGAQEFIAECRNNPEHPISYDIETSFSLKKNDEEQLRRDTQEITQIQFSLSEYAALVLPWSRKAREITQIIMNLPNPKLSWNGFTFDQPRLEREKIVFGGRQIDLMCAWHFLEPDLPMNLSFATGSLLGDRIAPWKHTMDEDINNYGALDVISLQLLNEAIFNRLWEEDLHNGYVEFIEKLYPILHDMSKRGFPVNTKERQNFKEWIQQEKIRVDDEIQQLVPDDLKDCHPKDGYKRLPKKPTKLITFGEDGVPFAFDSATNKWIKCVQRDFNGEIRWCRIKPFLVSSPVQVKRYAAANNHEIAKTRKGREWKQTADKKVLEKLADRVNDSFYKKLIELRELDKINSTYIDGWQTDENGKVHTEYHFGPASGQIGSREPNVQNMPKRKDELSKRIRRCIQADDGHTLLEIDMTAFHASTLAYVAKDPIYARLAKIDPHSFLAAHLLGIEGVDNWLQLSDQELAEKLEWIKTTYEWVRNKQAKPSILGIGFGMGVNKLYRMNEESFGSLAEAKKVHDLLKSLFPRIFEWQNEIRNEAHLQGKLTSPFGCVRRFYDVYSWDIDNGCWRPGTQSEECIAFPPSNIAHCHIKQSMVRMRENGWDEKYGMCNMIHDSLIFNCKDKFIDECIYNIKSEMEKKSTILIDSEIAPDGFWVAAEASIGKTWDKMKRVQ